MVAMSAPGTQRRLAAAQYFGRFRSEAVLHFSQRVGQFAEYLSSVVRRVFGDRLMQAT
jgi:hypothetical protein